MTARDLVTEEDVQRTIIEGLEIMRFQVLQTTHRTRITVCGTCGAQFRPSGGYGASKGVPDLLVFRPEWPPGCLLGLEVKRPGLAVAFSSQEQADLANAGRVIVVTGVDKALDAALAFDALVMRQK